MLRDVFDCLTAVCEKLCSKGVNGHYANGDIGSPPTKLEALAFEGREATQRSTPPPATGAGRENGGSRDVEPGGDLDGEEIPTEAARPGPPGRDPAANAVSPDSAGSGSPGTSWQEARSQGGAPGGRAAVGRDWSLESPGSPPETPESCDHFDREPPSLVGEKPPASAVRNLQLQKSRVQRQASPPPVPRREDPASRPFFTGRWPGGRNDYGGEAGIRFVAAVSSEVTALGRLAEPPLMEGTVVTLWQTDTQEPLATAEVGPKSRVEGNYAWEPLTDELVLHAGKEYRLTQRCRANMPDRWCDARATAEEVAVGSWASLASFVGGVARNSAGFPNREDGDLRRAGMVNFKAMLRPSPGPAMQLVSREQLAHSLARATAADEQRRGGGPQEVEGRLAALACLLELFVDELANLEPGTESTCGLLASASPGTLACADFAGTGRRDWKA
ncbi:unnamed protein product [Polarella glacialis]|uniref:Uncharacterized protein n=1 Tax=Polarella glacialis TaxID=89957 RepID=A0A813G6L9_POLGL|nr:unnamed protein product [Polarella glacialis]